MISIVASGLWILAKRLARVSSWCVIYVIVCISPTKERWPLHLDNTENASTTTSVDEIPHDLQPLKQAIDTLAFRRPNVSEVLTWWTTRLHRLEIHFLCLACIHLSWLTALVLLCHCSNLLRTCHPGWWKDGEAQWKRIASSAMKDRLCVPMKNSGIYFKCN